MPNMRESRPRQHDADFSMRVRALLEPPLPSSAEGRIAEALACAALSVLSSAELSQRLERRIDALLDAHLGAEALRLAHDDLHRARTLSYDEGGRETHVTVDEAARRMAVSRSTVYRWIGRPDKYFSQTHDAPELVPDRIPIEQLEELRQRRVEEEERDQAVRRLWEDLDDFRSRAERAIVAELSGAQEDLTVRFVGGFALRRGIALSDSAIRRWPSTGELRRPRGRPAKTYAAEEVARQLALREERQRRSQLKSASIQTLRRLLRELPN